MGRSYCDLPECGGFDEDEIGCTDCVLGAWLEDAICFSCHTAMYDDEDSYIEVDGMWYGPICSEKCVKKFHEKELWKE